MAIEGIFMAVGRGTVLTGKIEAGSLKIGDPLEVVGPRETISTICLGLETFRKSLDAAEVGDNVGILVKAVKKMMCKGALYWLRLIVLKHMIALMLKYML